MSMIKPHQRLILVSKAPEKPEKFDLFKIISTIVALLSFAASAVFYFINDAKSRSEYSENEEWKRAEYFDKKYYDFSRTEGNIAVRKILFYYTPAISFQNKYFILSAHDIHNMLSTVKPNELNGETNNQ